jgi:hypothetical protein
MSQNNFMCGAIIFRKGEEYFEKKRIGKTPSGREGIS